MHSRQIKTRSWVVGVVIAAVTGLFMVAAERTTGTAKLIAFEPLPAALTGETCEWEVATPHAGDGAVSLQARGGGAQGQPSSGQLCGGPGCAAVTAREPIRFIQDEAANFSSIAVDPVRNEVVVTDENRFRVMVFDRTANTPPGVASTEPKRVINGLRTHTQFASDVYIDPPTGEIYVVNNDTVHNTTVYGRNASGDVPPDREFVTPYGNYAIAVDEERQEVFLTVQHNGVILAYRKNSGMKPEDHAIRRIQGTNTRMADSHGIAFDSKNKLLFVANWGAQHQAVEGHEGYPGRPRIPLWPIGNYHHEIVRGTGRWVPPSITVFPSDGNGNIAPVRVIEGPKAQLQWPAGLAIDAERGELYVANSAGDAITVFRTDARGDVAPIRVLKGPRTLLRQPTDVFLDLVNDELWVANYGNHMAAVYRRTASGDTAPVRMIRTAPVNTPTPLMGNPYSIAYDSKREQILVPNCVAHPRIAAFARLADRNAAPVRSIQGQNTGLHRTMHAIGYDEIHDEIVVPLLMAQAIATFRGGASGDEKPIRVIQGPKTHNQRIEHLSLDPVNNEIYVWEENRTMVFDRLAQGDVAPKRVIEGVTNVAVDPIHNLLISIGGRRIRIFDRTVEGTNPKPLRVIEGPRTGLGGASTVRLYPPAGRIVVIVRGGRGEGGGEDGGLESASSASPESLASARSFTGIWSIYDEGDVPPRWSIGGPNGMLRNPRGVTLDPVHKTIMISDKFLNGLLTYSFPELFESDRDPRQTAQR
jgi:DNA-binding beta-propeller fold protein YncE